MALWLAHMCSTVLQQGGATTGRSHSREELEQGGARLVFFIIPTHYPAQPSHRVGEGG